MSLMRLVWSSPTHFLIGGGCSIVLVKETNMVLYVEGIKPNVSSGKADKTQKKFLGGDFSIFALNFRERIWLCQSAIKLSAAICFLLLLHATFCHWEAKTKQRNNRYTWGNVIDEASPLFSSLLMTTNPFSNWWRVQQCNGQREQFGLLCRGDKAELSSDKADKTQKKVSRRELLRFCTWKKVFRRTKWTTSL